MWQHALYGASLSLYSIWLYTPLKNTIYKNTILKNTVWKNIIWKDDIGIIGIIAFLCIFLDLAVGYCVSLGIALAVG